ncbi:hypothetical protein MG5_05954 [Candida albicans P57072]|uniref:Uncharacterized protein n=4 Tax=Candida albicans TaxID=5476 RepID=Q59V65_CANAL|nr:uncharacterized protein CAALFM_CR06330CA [Candida albicans SC5314]KGQ81941.1 hypothetical protein MEO_05938 [Candida albicans P94015]KGQ82619.1 hypothetical protein MG1_06009 [Candida albicans GC75]KGQ83213.1 hypothetical protein MEU_05976 [Candida albicans P37005]KGR02084.1 hypothetical protein MG5_05954 [Candida albicans P57072]KGR02348.1 hypothetical protein MG3_06006 [Candida albicans P78048]KGR06101.1 hypothetical protein MG9_05998 [Candida albicans P37037]KGT63850.1 hypothetical pro|eukprot:XP_713512.1 hypothetical protein CAALFM_CR06330CA [Candida albicans SC5314]
MMRRTSKKQQRKKDWKKKMRKEINSNSENRYYKDQHCGYPNTSLPTKDYINLIIIMSDTEEIPVIEQEELDNPLRIILVIDHPENKESNEMEERLLDSIQSFKQMDQFFDKFDETIAIPNESHIKYEVGSDGLVVIIVDNLKLRDEVLVFIDGYNDGHENDTTENEDEPQDKKKSKKELEAGK